MLHVRFFVSRLASAGVVKARTKYDARSASIDPDHGFPIGCS
jgi:hypothetical protein